MVYARWVAHATNRSEALPYTINYAGGADTVIVNQRQDGGTFVLLGTYSFMVGTGGNVTITYTRQGDDDIVIADAMKFVPADILPEVIDIKRTHYYAWSEQEAKPYLVVLDGEINYYMVIDDGDDVVEGGEILPTSSPPEDVVSGRDYVAERQNFANWYQFYRRRELTATAAVARSINLIQGVRIGIYSINGNIVQPVVPINVDGIDETSVLLDSLYGLTLRARGTPLRRALEEVGKYYYNSSAMLGGSPYAVSDSGGDCQQAFSIVMTDGYWNGGNPNVANADGDDNTAFDGSGGYGDTYTGTLADVAMYYYETDLRTDLANSVPANEADGATHQHMVTYGVSFGVTGTLTPEDWDVVSGPYPPWPDPKYVNAHKVDDLYHAAVNGRWEFLSASNPSDLIDSLTGIMLSIQSRVGSAASVSINGNQLYKTVDGNTLVFQASYNSDGWTGDVKAYGVDTITGEVDVTPLWSAAENLQDLDWNVDRVIATYDGTKGIPFRYNDDLTDPQKIVLGSDLVADSPADQNASSILDYIRGDNGNEEKKGGNFRNRSYILGDIVNSSPVYDNGMLYTGGNDGMMHAFDASTGNEIFAYVPQIVFANLADLADPNYSHKFFVNLPPVVQAVTLAGADRLLVGGLGKGGKGYYALNVTDPSGLDESTLADLVLWEFTDVADLGYTYSRPVIVPSNNGGQWVVIFGNGYNSQNGHAVLFILDAANGSVIRKIDTGAGLCNGLSSPVAVDNNYDGKVDYVYAGDLEGNLWKFDLQGSAAAWDVAYKDQSNNPAPLFQAKDLSGNPQPITTRPDVLLHCRQGGYLVIFGTGRYLGDKDLISSGSHTVYGIWDYGDDDDNSEYLGSFERAAAKKLSNPDLRNEVTLLEQTIVSGNWTTSDGQSVRIMTATDPVWATVEDNQAGQELNPGTTECDDSIDNDTDGSTDEADECNAHAGWYFDLPENGEMMVSDVVVKYGRALVVSFTPEQTPCGYGGDSIYHQLNACSGGRPSTKTFDVYVDGVINDQDLINIGTEVNPIWVPATGIQISGRLQLPAVLQLGSGNLEMNYLSSSTGAIKTVKTKGTKLGMIYWMHLR
jgi:type IV pilus assembly protein PilY1